jgi:transcription antitermination factor NusG
MSPREETGWFVLRTRSRHEKAIEAELDHKRITVYLPKIIQARQWRDRIKKVELPLFPGYVFVKPDPAQFCALSFIRGSRGLLYANNRPGIVFDSEISAIQTILGADLPLDILPTLTPGVKVRVVAGPLAGVQGELVSRKNTHRLVVNAEIMGQSVSVEINRNQVVVI